MNSSASIIVSWLLLIALASSILLRVLLLVLERSFTRTSLSGLVMVVIWLHRMLILLLCATGLVVLLPVGIFGIGIGSGFAGSSSEFFPHMVALLVLALYLLAVLILNFPGFPLALHRRLFYTIQLLLLPALLALVEPLIFLVLFGAISLLFGIWLLNLRDRLRYEKETEDKTLKS